MSLTPLVFLTLPIDLFRLAFPPTPRLFLGGMEYLLPLADEVAAVAEVRINPALS
jgi:hypothetical protein